MWLGHSNHYCIFNLKLIDKETCSLKSYSFHWNLCWFIEIFCIMYCFCINCLMWLFLIFLVYIDFLQTPHSRGNITTAIHGQASSNMIGNTAASPSRIISTGHQGHAAAGLPPVSVPGSQFVASSPSPATSGGASSVFRDSRLTSPSWNC